MNSPKSGSPAKSANLNADGHPCAATNDASTAHLKIFIGGLKPMTDSAALKEHFSVFGTVLDAVVMTKKDEWSQTFKSRGFGFVIFESKESCEMALQDRNVIDDHEVKVKRADSGHKVDKNDSNRGHSTVESTKVYVGNLAQDTTTEMLQEYFEQFGAIATVDRCHGFGFVGFAGGDQGSAEEAAQKCKAQCGHQINGNFVQVKPAVSKKSKGIHFC